MIFVYRIDREGNFTFINDAIQKLGYQPEELLGKHFSEIILPADVERVSQSKVLAKYKGKLTGDKNAPKLFDERRSGNRKTTGLEVCLIAKSGRLQPGLVEMIGKEMVIVEINSAGMYQISNSAKMKVFIGTVGVIRDISDRKRMEEDLRKARDNLEVKVKERTADLQAVNRSLQEQIVERKQAEKRLIEAMKKREDLERIINLSPVTVWLWRNAEGWPVEFVSENVRNLGYTPEDFYTGRVPFASIVHLDDLPRVAGEVARYSKEEGLEGFTQEYRILASDR